jgi:SAM-dependent methyltransferase
MDLRVRRLSGGLGALSDRHAGFALASPSRLCEATLMDASGPNAEQITYWNEQTGPKWVAEQAALDRMIAPFGERAMAALGVAAGHDVVDVGCGCGDTSLELGRRVTASGSVLGVDISAPMLGRARERAKAEGLAHVHFAAADAQTHRFPPASADRIFSRFGVMFFAEPPGAFANLRATLRPDGRLGFVCWQPVTENHWMLVPVMAAAQIVALPPPPPPDAPGPFQLGDKDKLAGVLSAAGFRDVAIESFAPKIVVGGGRDLDQTVAFVLQLGPVGAVLRQQPDADMARVSAAVREAIAPYETPEGVAMPSATWIVTARP